MGTMQLSQFISELRFDLANRDDADLSDARLTLMLNAAYQHVCRPEVKRHRSMEYRHSITLVQGVNDYTYTPDGTVNIIDVRHIHHIDAAVETPTVRRTKLLPRGLFWFRERTINTGPPRIYATQSTSLLIDPVPGASEDGQLLLIDSWREPALLALDTDTTAIDSVFDEVILLGAKWRAEYRLGYRDRAELTKQDYAAMLSEYQDQGQLTAEDTGWRVEFPQE